MKNIKIIGSGYETGKHAISNQDLEKVIDTNNEWIMTRTGIKNRFVSETENTSDLGYLAAKKAIENAKIDAKQIDLIIVATMTPDNFTPSSACLIQEKLGLNGNHVMAFDINAACSGFLYAMHVATALLSQYKCALVIGAETLSKIIDWKDRNTCVLFGDGAGALILKKSKSSNEMNFYAQSIGDSEGILKAGGIQLHKPLKNTTKSFEYLHMEGKEVFRFAVKAVEDGINEVLKQSNKTLEEIDLIIPHQANIRIIQNVAKHMNLDIEKFFINIDKIGNVSAASIPIAYAQALEEERIKPGMKIILVGFGAGLTYASAYIEI